MIVSDAYTVFIIYGASGSVNDAPGSINDASGSINDASGSINDASMSIIENCRVMLQIVVSLLRLL